MVCPRRLRHAASTVAIIATIALVGLSRPPADRPPLPPAAAAPPRVETKLPRLHPVTAALKKDDSSPHTASPRVDRQAPDREWAATFPLPDASAGASNSPATSREEAPRLRSATDAGRDDRTVPQLMVCHPDARGAFAAADVIQDCINRAPAFSNVTLEHLVIDGNRAARTASTAAQFCLHGDTAYGFNVTVLYCTDCVLDDVVSRHG